MVFRYLPSSKTALRYPGVTLIELLVVISLLALPTALMTPNLQQGNPIVDLEKRAKALAPGSTRQGLWQLHTVSDSSFAERHRTANSFLRTT